MTEPLFLADLDHPQPGDRVAVTGDEGRHAVSVRRIRVGEVVLVADGAGVAVRGPVETADKTGLTLRVADVLHSPRHPVRYVAVQALAKGDRDEAAVEMLTELGVDEIIPWQAARSVVRWAPDRVERSLGRWRTIAREATKQSRRFRVPLVSAPVTTAQLAARVAQADLAVVLHEDAEAPLSNLHLPATGEILFIVGPEGSIAPDELAALSHAGGRLALLSDGVLRTSTAGVVALAQLQVLARAR